MATFITNIQLQDADEKDYNFLYKELEKESFKGENVTDKSLAYIAEKETFCRESNLTILEINEAVVRAISKTGKKYSFYTITKKHFSHTNP